MLKALILDFGGVVFENVSDYKGPKGPLQSDPELWQKARVGEIEDQVLFEHIANNYSVDSETVRDWLLSKRQVNQELLELLKHLKPGIKTAVLNNGLKTLFHDLLDKYKAKGNFNVLVNSAEEKVEKPDPEVYRRTCERLGVMSEECLFVDDNEKLIEGAIKLGIKTHFFSSVADLEAELTRLGMV